MAPKRLVASVDRFARKIAKYSKRGRPLAALSAEDTPVDICATVRGGSEVVAYARKMGLKTVALKDFMIFGDGKSGAQVQAMVHDNWVALGIAWSAERENRVVVEVLDCDAKRIPAATWNNCCRDDRTRDEQNRAGKTGPKWGGVNAVVLCATELRPLLAAARLRKETQRRARGEEVLTAGIVTALAASARNEAYRLAIEEGFTPAECQAAADVAEAEAERSWEKLIEAQLKKL